MVLLATAQITLSGPGGAQLPVRALVDQGSEDSFIKESIVHSLQLRKHRANIPLTGMGVSPADTARAIAQVTISSVADPSFHLETEALVLPLLTSKLPPRFPRDLDLSQFDGLQLSDPSFYTPNSVEAVLGSDVYCRILRSGLHRFPLTSLIAQDTALGWIVSGSTKPVVLRRADSLPQTTLTIGHCNSDNGLQETLLRFWSVEEIPVTSSMMKPEEESCERLFVNTFSRSANGRYVVRLPLKAGLPTVYAETRQMALGSLSTTHRRFSRDPRLADAYREFMRVYEELGHMERVPGPQVSNSRAWYIPHHAVIQPSPTKLKLRVVFDASRRTSNQYCLNDFLMPDRKSVV